MDFAKDGLEFLGFRLSWCKGRSRKNYPHCEPSAKSTQNLRDAVREETGRDTHWKEPEEVIQRINQRVRGWAGYFHCGNSTKVFAKMQWYVEERVRLWLWKKHAKSRGRYAPEYTHQNLKEKYGLYQMPDYAARWNS